MWRGTIRSSLHCHACNEVKIDEDHNLSERHLKNIALFEFSLWRGQHYEKQSGILICCSAQSSNAMLINCVDTRIKLSVRPNEEIKCNFTLKNDTVREDLFIYFAKVVHTKLNFTMNDHGLGIGCIPKCIRPYETLGRDINVTFSSPDIGQYECPILFSFKKMLTNEDIYLIRDIIIVVEDKQLLNDEVLDSPFGGKPVYADTLYKATCKGNKITSEFKVPKEKQKIFAKNLMVSKGTSEEKELAKEIKTIFDTGATPENYTNFFHNLLWYEETIERIQLQRYNMCNVRLERVSDAYLLVVPGLAEKRPSLMLGDMVYVKPSNTNKVMFEGVISEVMEEAIYIRGFHPEFTNYYSTVGNYDIRFLICRMPLERMHKGLSRGEEEGMLTRAFPNTKPNDSNHVIKPIEQFLNLDVKDNEEQRCAVEHILANTSGTAPYLIHGPPGTGKTVTVVETILQIIKQSPSKRILVCTDSNMAADHVAMQLVKYAYHFKEKFLLRANAKCRVWETMPAVLVPYSNGTSRVDWTPVHIKKFSSYQVVVTTLAHSAKYANARRKHHLERHITHLFIDEAAQALEPMFILPTCGLLNPHGTLVLAGDPLQLGPVVISPVAKRAGLGTSLMERLKNTCELYSDERNDPNYMVMLRNNFRSHPDIIELPSKMFYKEQLRACAELDPLSTLNILTGNNDSRAIVFHGVLSTERRMGKSPSFFNPLEQVLVHRYVLALIEKYKVPFEDIGIVTPYIRQMQMIRYWLNIKGYYGIEVGTVEAFQGKEKRFVIISTVRANADLLSHDAMFQLGFLADGKRFNVAITRAKAKVIVIGNPLCLNLNDKWRVYIQKCRQLGTYYGFDYEGNDNTMVYEELANNISHLLMHHSS